ncbi:hypothetical protein IU500_23345 [Nocardia terpenica]|uniref:Uncharacterized protein n=1 Tax=Nocardia terpenica TaxID=455432 RepID=A0A164MV50_9NOCA|nr:hypothetical protein [Nocardia terpenica]ATL66991.1 hypothetical protein CRH09_13020 [Nocardia terpenica]KZM73692.1 hypothetical protein AWN90_34490 [Nocardia terpenica]MBF6064397.1 hypothetical protein [Nocardia terpenica]MBF6106979.1 hypothetical protein [Nocardia terpenica]MBF6114365.1 hypothetical protein [Nocardia terpenica]
MSVTHALLAQTVDAAQHYEAAGILKKIRDAVLIFLLVVFLIGLFIGLFVGYAIGRSVGRR